MRVGVEGLGIPLVGGISEHEALISSTEFSLFLVSVNGSCDVSVLSMDVADDLHVGAVESNVLRGVTNLTADFASDLLKVDFTVVCLSEKNNHAGLGGGLHGDLSIGVESKGGIEATV